ncbi:class I SAM-dependent methyltransferase [Deltaproteobacteria bacterium]|nr:class I SAM-dependent methyltransferase [Deltaproteobacteria bacterium]
MDQPKINLDFYSGEDLYSDGSIENEILDIVKSNNDFSKILAADKRWPVLYHLSPLRRNLLEWYDFDSSASLLEIGAGCGALTGLFCEKVEEVVAVELSKRRAEVIANWHKDKSNLEIVVGNLNDISFDKKFDYITLIGVLEYAGKYTGTDNPYYNFLVQIKKYLTPEGTLIVAIENKFGLKYWAGAKEDHNGKYFDSIENYLDDSSIKTFGRAELEDLLNLAGFKTVKFYYPMPDYKLPIQVFSDDFLPDIGQIFGISPNYDNERMVLFNEATAYDNIIINKQFDFFANSFLLFCNNSGKRPDTVYSKFNRERLPAFQIETSIYREKEKLGVLKKPLTSEAKGHIASLHNNYELLKDHYRNIKIADAQYRDENIVFEFVNGESLDRLLVESVFKRDISQFYLLLDRFVDSVRSFPLSEGDDSGNNEDSSGIFGDFTGITSCDYLEIANIDLRLDNIILNEDNIFEIFDYEWVFNFSIPVNFVIFRNIEAFCGKYTEYIKDFISLQELLDRYKISNAEIKIYRRMEKIFQAYVMGKSEDYMIKKAYKKPLVLFRKRKYKLRDILKRPRLLFGKSITLP